MTKTKTKHPKLKTNGKKDGSPRYKKGVHPTYDQEYELRSRKSFILNDKVRANDIANSARMYDVHSCKSTLEGMLEGKSKDNPGHYRVGTVWYRANIPNATEQLKRVHLEHRRWAKEQVRKALYLELPKHWPADLLVKRLRAEATLDIYNAERHRLLNRIEELESRQKKEAEEKFLPRGPISVSFDPKSSEIDGQQVDILSGEIPIPYICDDRSPYLGMPIKDYLQMAREWKAHIQKLGEAEGEKIIQRLEKEVEQGKRTVPPTRMMKRNLRKKTWKELKFDIDDFPKWPKDAKSVDELKTMEVEK